MALQDNVRVMLLTCSTNRPMKKRGGTAAGVPRASGEGGPSAANGGPANQVSLRCACVIIVAQGCHFNATLFLPRANSISIGDGIAWCQHTRASSGYGSGAAESHIPTQSSANPVLPSFPAQPAFPLLLISHKMPQRTHADNPPGRERRLLLRVRWCRRSCLLRKLHQVVPF